MNHKRRLHDAIVGIVITVGVALGYYVSVHWLLLPTVIGVTLIQSGFTGFAPCTLYSIGSFLPKARLTHPVIAQSKPSRRVACSFVRTPPR